MSHDSETLTSFLSSREAKLLRQIKDLRNTLAPLERELDDVRKAKSLIFERGDAFRGVQVIYKFPDDTVHVIPRVKVSKTSSPSDMTLKQMVVLALREQFPNGATAKELLQFFKNAWGRDVQRPSLSPQLSRLKEDRIIDRKGKVWSLVAPRNDEAPTEQTEGASKVTGKDMGLEHPTLPNLNPA